MNEAKLVSIIINNYNYGRFLKDCIESALNQTYPDTKVIVVDDGSTDDSRKIISGYGDRIIPVLKENGGQGAAFNVGVKVSRGEVICFLDSDDMLLPTAMEKALALFQDSDVVNVHWRLWEIDKDGRRTGRTRPQRGTLTEGNLRDSMIRRGPNSYIWSPTSGNAWTRRFLESIFPVPEQGYKSGADSYLAVLAPLYGTIKTVSEPQALYRLHGQNDHEKRSLEQTLSICDQDCTVLQSRLREMGIDANPERWEVNWWRHRLHSAIQDIKALIPEGDTFILVDQDEWGTRGVVAGRRALPFIERKGLYAGSPPDDATAIRELERQRQSGAHFIVFAWQAFWWLEYFSVFHTDLRSSFRCVLENERLVVFDLRL